MHEQYSYCKNIAYISVILWGYVLIWYSCGDMRLIAKLKSTQHIKVEIDLDEMDLIKVYVLEKHGLNVSLHHSQVSRHNL